MIVAGLSLDQAPPFSVPFRFYLTAPLFLALAGLLAAFSSYEWATDRWAPAALAMTHLITLGYLGMVMLGSMMQMLPVVAGAALPFVRSVGGLSHIALLAGIPFLCWGLSAGQHDAMLIGLLACAAGLLVFLAGSGASLLKAHDSHTVRAMRFAWLGLLVTILIGLALAAWMLGQHPLQDPHSLIAMHVASGLLGWVSMLVMGVAYQVIPMLQVTPAYPTILAHWLAPALGGLLMLFSSTYLADISPAVRDVTTLGMTGIVTTFAMATLDRLNRRRRKLADATLHFWQLGMCSLIAAALLVGLGMLWADGLNERWPVLAGILFLIGFAASIVTGMLLKIVPFLAWFHLHAQVGLKQTPFGNMKDFLPDRQANRLFALHATALACLLPTPWLPGLGIPGGLALAAAALYLSRLMWQAWRLFRQHGGHA